MLEALRNIFTAGGIAKTGASMLDNAFFTDQERAAFMLDYLKASAPMAITRRVIACFVLAVWSVCILILIFLFFTNADLYKGFSGFMDLHINTPFSVIMAFYFLAHVVGRGKA